MESFSLFYIYIYIYIYIYLLVKEECEYYGDICKEIKTKMHWYYAVNCRGIQHHEFDKTWWWCSDLTENSEGGEGQHENDRYHDQSIYPLLDE